MDEYVVVVSRLSEWQRDMMDRQSKLIGRIFEYLFDGFQHQSIRRWEDDGGAIVD